MNIWVVFIHLLHRFIIFIAHLTIFQTLFWLLWKQPTNKLSLMELIFQCKKKSKGFINILVTLHVNEDTKSEGKNRAWLEDKEWTEVLTKEFVIFHSIFYRQRNYVPSYLPILCRIFPFHNCFCFFKSHSVNALVIMCSLCH